MKTRLAAGIGEAAALEAYRELVRRLIENLHGLSGVELRYTPDDAVEEIQTWRLDSWTAAPQGGGDLGARLQRAFEKIAECGLGKVVLIGSDCPAVTRSDIREAMDQSADHDAVLGPSRDGGYWLIGLKQTHPELFQKMEWSTPGVFEETITRMRRLNSTCAIPPGKNGR